MNIRDPQGVRNANTPIDEINRRPQTGVGLIHRQSKGAIMPNSYQGTGNLGDSRALKTVQVNGEERKVAELRVFFDNYRPDGQGVWSRQAATGWMSPSGTTRLNRQPGCCARGRGCM